MALRLDRLIRLRNARGRAAHRLSRRLDAHSPHSLYLEAWELCQRIDREYRILATRRADQYMRVR